MQKRVKVSFREQAKAVVCDTTVEWIADSDKIPEDLLRAVLEEAEELFDKASTIAATRTMRKI